MPIAIASKPLIKPRERLERIRKQKIEERRLPSNLGKAFLSSPNTERVKTARQKALNVIQTRLQEARKNLREAQTLKEKTILRARIAKLGFLTRIPLTTRRLFISAIAVKDRITLEHSERVGSLTTLLGRELGVKIPQDIGLFHDLGKIDTPDSILMGTGRLSEEEFARMKEHPVKGFEMLKGIASRETLDAAKYHHEKFSGGGYPEGISGKRIPRIARILAVADVFDALQNARSYKAPKTIAQVMEIMKKDIGTHFDPEVFDALERLKAKGLLREAPEIQKPREKIGLLDLFFPKPAPIPKQA